MHRLKKHWMYTMCGGEAAPQSCEELTSASFPKHDIPNKELLVTKKDVTQLLGSYCWDSKDIFFTFLGSHLIVHFNIL